MDDLPSGNPDRALRRAARAMMSLGLLGIVAGLLIAVASSWLFVDALRPKRSSPGPGDSSLVVFIVGAGGIAAVAFLFLPGLSFVVASVYLRRYRPWAVILGLVTAGLLLIACLLILSRTIGAALDLGGTYLAIPAAGAFACAALALLIYRLAASWSAVRVHQREAAATKAFPVDGCPGVMPAPEEGGGPLT